MGKSTVARAVGRAEGARVISIDRILDDEGIEEWDADRVALRSFLRANEFAVAQAARALDAGRPTLIEGNFYWNKQVEDLVDRLPSPALVVHLVAPLELCLSRDAGRPEPAPDAGPKAGDHMGAEAVQAVFGYVRPFPGERSVDARGSVAEVVGRVREVWRDWRSTRVAG